MRGWVCDSSTIILKSIESRVVAEPSIYLGNHSHLDKSGNHVSLETNVCYNNDYHLMQFT